MFFISRASHLSYNFGHCPNILPFWGWGSFNVTFLWAELMAVCVILRALPLYSLQKGVSQGPTGKRSLPAAVSWWWWGWVVERGRIAVSLAPITVGDKFSCSFSVSSSVCLFIVTSLTSHAWPLVNSTTPVFLLNSLLTLY